MYDTKFHFNDHNPNKISMEAQLPFIKGLKPYKIHEDNIPARKQSSKSIRLLGNPSIYVDNNSEECFLYRFMTVYKSTNIT